MPSCKTPPKIETVSAFLNFDSNEVVKGCVYGYLFIKNLNLLTFNWLFFKVTSVYFDDGYHKTNVYFLENLRGGHKVDGPAIIMDKLSTIVIEPGKVN